MTLFAILNWFFPPILHVTIGVLFSLIQVNIELDKGKRHFFGGSKSPSNLNILSLIYFQVD